MTRPVYIIGAGFSAGLGFPLTKELLQLALSRMENQEKKKVERIVAFHFPDFRSSDTKTYPNIEDLLTRIRVNIELFRATRKRQGRLRLRDLQSAEMSLLHELTRLFHEIRTQIGQPAWLTAFVDRITQERATLISFNWDLVLDVLIGGDQPNSGIYAVGLRPTIGPCLLKPHGSLNWYGARLAQYIKEGRTFLLWKPTQRSEERFDSIWLYKYPRQPTTSVPGRQYIPWVVAPTFLKSFDHPFFQRIFQFAVERLGRAEVVYFLGYSLPTYDFHAEFMLRCGFHQQREGEILSKNRRAKATGLARVVVVDPDTDAARRIQKALGITCEHEQTTVATWIRSGRFT